MSVTFNTREKKITVASESGFAQDYFDSESYLTDFPDREADCYVFTHVPPITATIVPQVITMRQAKLVLLVAGLLDTVNTVVASAGQATQIEWEYAAEVNRTWPTLVALQSALGLSDAELDNLFIAGAAL